jgi:hypothetical protein
VLEACRSCAACLGMVRARIHNGRMWCDVMRLHIGTVHGHSGVRWWS